MLLMLLTIHRPRSREVYGGRTWYPDSDLEPMFIADFTYDSELQEDFPPALRSFKLQLQT